MRTHALAYGFALAAIALLSGTNAGTRVAQAQPEREAAGGSNSARVEFDHPGGANAVVELDLPAGLFGDVVGLGDAAIAGVAEALLKAQTSDEATKADVKLATDQLAAIRTIIGSIQGALGEVHVRVYREDIDADAVAGHYASKLDGSAWAKIANVRDGEKCASVFLMREEGAIRGAFVVATEGRELVLVNVLCDISPDRVKQITQQATSMGLELGGDEVLREIAEEIRGKH